MLAAKKIHKNLNESIDTIIANKASYVKNPNRDFVRNRKLSMENTMVEILSMGGESLPKEMIKYAEINNIELTPSAFIQQRAKISSAAFKDVFNKFNELCHDVKKHKGYRILAVDGSEIDCSRNPDSENFMVTPNNPKGFNKVHLNALYDVINKTFVDAYLQPISEQDEDTALINMVKDRNFYEKTIIIADRGYECYNTFVHLIKKENVDFIIRVKQDKTALKIISNLPMCELDTEVKKELTTTQRKEDKILGRIYIQTHRNKSRKYSSNTINRRFEFESPYTLKVRVVRFLLDTGEYETLVTTLKKEEFSLKEIKELYHMRWGIETSFRGVKYSEGLVNLHSKKDEFVKQEIYAALTMYNYCSRIASAVPVEKKKKTKYAYSINYSVAVSVCKHFFRKQKANFDALIRTISKHTVPIRPGRKDKRNIKLKGFVGFTYRVAA